MGSKDLTGFPLKITGQQKTLVRKSKQYVEMLKSGSLEQILTGDILRVMNIKPSVQKSPAALHG